MSRFILLFSILVLASPLLAQKYNTALGLRFGNNHYGLSVKQRLLKRTTLEGMAVIDPLQYTGTILAQQHFPVVGRGLNIYLGPGVHVGERKETGQFYGVDMMVGAELKLPALPFVVSADIKPAYHFDHSEWFDFSTALSLHYVIGKDTRAKKDREKRKKMRAKQRAKKQKVKEKQKAKIQKERANEKDNEKQPWLNFDFLKKDNKDN